MPSPAYLAQPNIQRLPSLLRDIQSGEIRIPRFQRPFVWEDDQRLDLFRSIYEGIPIGSILIWRTKDHALPCYDHLGRRVLSWPAKPEGETIIHQYVLDGHQRLTTLFDALGAGVPASGDQLLEVPSDAGDDEERSWPIYFDLEERAFRLHQKGELPRTWLPLAILLDPYQLFDFQKELLSAGVERALINRAEALASTFKDYTVPVVPIVTEDLELATLSFQRVNSGGTRMTEVHMVSALTWSRDFDLNERIKEVLEDLREVGWQDLEEKMILNACKAALDLDIYYSRTEEITAEIKKHPQVLEEATESLKAAARFLHDHCRVYGPAVLPYSFQVVLLADVMQRVTSGFQQEPSPEIIQSLVKWFWLTTYTEHFAGISAVRLARTLDHLRKVADGEAESEPPSMSREVTALPRRFDFRAARSRAIAFRLAELNPRGGGSERHDPFQLLADYGRDAMPLLVPSREVATRQAQGPENRILVHPREANKLRHSLRLVAIPYQHHHRTPGDLLSGHAISRGATAEALGRRDLQEFLRLRREELISLERTFVEGLGLVYSGD